VRPKQAELFSWESVGFKGSIQAEQYLRPIMPELIEKPIKNVFNAKFYINLSIGGLKSDRLLAQVLSKGHF
jgi:hypothetical protein